MRLRQVGQTKLFDTQFALAVVDIRLAGEGDGGRIHCVSVAVAEDVGCEAARVGSVERRTVPVACGRVARPTAAGSVGR